MCPVRHPQAQHLSDAVGGHSKVSPARAKTGPTADASDSYRPIAFFNGPPSSPSAAHLGNVIHAVARLQDVGLVPLEGSLPAPVRALPEDVQKSEPLVGPSGGTLEKMAPRAKAAPFTGNINNPDGTVAYGNINGENAYLGWMEVPQHLRGKGLGRNLYQQWESKLPATVKRVYLHAATEQDPGLSDFYGKLGFRPASPDECDWRQHVDPDVEDHYEDRPFLRRDLPRE